MNNLHAILRGANADGQLFPHPCLTGDGNQDGAVMFGQYVAGKRGAQTINWGYGDQVEIQPR
jgi:hypothetical protein